MYMMAGILGSRPVTVLQNSVPEPAKKTENVVVKTEDEAPSAKVEETAEQLE
jgi:hypothetical protein